MQIILPCLADPTDVVIQGEQLVPPAAPLNAVALSLSWIPLLQGELIGDVPLGNPVPRAPIGQHELYSVPKQTGPKVMSGGELIWFDIGKQPIDVFVDPIQRFLNSAFQVDQTGFMLTLYDTKTIGAPEPIAQFMVPEAETMGNLVITIPRGAVYRSGLVKRITAPTLSSNFMTRSLEVMVESTMKWFIAGQTMDGASTPIPGCRVIVLQSDKLRVSPDLSSNPVVADVTSDAGGNYSVQVPAQIPHQAIGYLVDGPDVGGVTVNNVIPTEG